MSNLLSQEEDNTPFIIRWIGDHSTLVRWVSLLLLILLAVLLRFLFTQQETHEEDYQRAETEAACLLHGRGEEELLDASHRIEELCHRHEELTPRFASLLAQQHLLAGEENAARELLEPLLSSDHPETESFRNYAQASLLIAEGKLEEALALSYATLSPPGTLLQGHLLLRIALLEEELGDLTAAAEAWDKLLEALETKSLPASFLDSWERGRVSLHSFAHAHRAHCHK